MGRLAAQIGAKPYLDSNVWIYSIERVAGLHVFADAMFVASDNAELNVVCSELALSEVLVKPMESGDHRLTQVYVSALQTVGSRSIVPVSRDVLMRASEIRAKHRLKLPDAIHAATAELSGCTSFITNDQRFNGRVAIPVVMLTGLVI